ncbi:MAG: ArsR/SmtB family transcription factor [Halobacteriales archaeon]
MPEDVAPERLFALLDDEHARALLVRLTEEPMTAQQLHATTDASLATVYRRLDDLADCGLVAERTRIDGDGNHYAVYEAALGELRVRPTGEGFEVAVDASEDVADRFTRVWEGMG